jgi:hypothetical protein
MLKAREHVLDKIIVTPEEIETLAVGAEPEPEPEPKPEVESPPKNDDEEKTDKLRMAKPLFQTL